MQSTVGANVGAAGSYEDKSLIVRIFRMWSFPSGTTSIDSNYSTDCNNQHIVDNESSDQKIKILVLSLLTGKKMSKQILAEANLDWSDARMKKFLRSLSEVGEEKKAGKILFYKLGYEEPSLFNENF